ncbi:transcriptional regulator [Aquitalea pelogenes]|uniref:transcriptional regulator n=1 Tax=Aquitalea pelogenes TaxID=1293573 RepID=UPI0035AE6D6F
MKAEALERACSLLGSQAALARAVGVKPPVIQQWMKGERPIPTARCVAIEKATSGAVTRQQLRPDDWQNHWPELSKAA